MKELNRFIKELPKISHNNLNALIRRMYKWKEELQQELETGLLDIHEIETRKNALIMVSTCISKAEHEKQFRKTCKEKRSYQSRKERITQVVKASQRGLTNKEIAALTGYQVNSVTSITRDLKNSGVLELNKVRLINRYGDRSIANCYSYIEQSNPLQEEVDELKLLLSAA